ncbi:GntR family transcriptional regulator [Hoeflea sp. G2-23]|uniref:GntR family transcriptional regulator n=1 Tax=Hoeflea algicola TaxID=2983763 RepID=A0ABT3ZDD5_9HYPH|nr:GntR family transcriptional regulator [Hoeflea algicola]MCY0149241.1 GntR family transcriptional regulator [Hoeflea algicola]
MSLNALIEQLRSGPFTDAKQGGPIYIRLARALEGLIESRWLAPGQPLPPERELAQGLSIARITARNAYKMLLEAGHLDVRQGSGTFVAERPVRIEQPLWDLSSFSQDMRLRGMEPGTRVLGSDVRLPSPEEVLLFGVARKEMMLRLDRLRLADGMPVAVERAVMPQRLVGSEQIGAGSLYDALARHGHRPVRALQKLTATVFEPVEAELLGVEPGAPCLLIERVSRSIDQQVVEHTRSHYRGDIYDFVAELTTGE